MLYEVITGEPQQADHDTAAQRLGGGPGDRTLVSDPQPATGASGGEPLLEPAA